MKKELLHLVNDLPSILNELVELIKKKEIQEACNYFRLFSDFMVNFNEGQEVILNFLKFSFLIH